MDLDPDEQRSRAAVLSGVPVQRSLQVHSPAEVWLDDREHLDEAERVDRLAADYDLVTSLAWQQFQGPDYDRFATELARYGKAVIGGWIRRGLIFAKCRDRGTGGLPEPPLGVFDDPDAVDELANETVALALHRFRTDVLMTGQWDPRKKASLRTYFIGQCLLRFANIYRQWLKTEGHRHHLPTDHATLDNLNSTHVPSPEHRVIDLTRVGQALGAVPNPRARQALVLYAGGLSHQEVGQRLGISEKAVERMIAYERNRMKKRGLA